MVTPFFLSSILIVKLYEIFQSCERGSLKFSTIIPNILLWLCGKGGGGGGPLLENQLGINIQLHGFIYIIYFLNFWLSLHLEKRMAKTQIC